MSFTRKAPKKRKKRRMSKAAKASFAARMAKARKAKTHKAKKHKPAKKRKSSSVSPAVLARAVAAYEGRGTPHISRSTLEKALAAYSGEGRHSTPKYPKYKPRRKRKSSIVLSENPIHFPKTARGRPSKIRFWLLDVYTGSKVRTYIGRADRTTAERDAMKKMVRLKADRVALSGPYLKRPHVSSVRK